MLNIKQDGKYFIKDTELILTTEDQDKFKHIDIAKNIINIVETGYPPFNIAVVGKWGMGKSSLIKHVTTHFERKKDKYVIEEINAWKYEKEALRKVFIRQILSKLGHKEDNAVKEFLNRISSFTGNTVSDKIGIGEYLIKFIPFLVLALSLSFLGILFSISFDYINAFLGGVDFIFSKALQSALKRFMDNFYIPLAIAMVPKLISTCSGRFNFHLVPPIKDTDEYEEILKNCLSLDKNKDKVIITVVDDLDRLTPTKIVEALDAIKAFVNYDKCIFIVPFDDSILKQALKKKTTNLLNNEQLLIESELFLDKLFQYKIFLPDVIVSDLSDYAIKLTEYEAPALYKLLSANSQFERLCKEILIHKGVKTPRQVKKIINAFANNVLLAHRRNNDNKIFTSEAGINMIAKIAVLQADFSGFYRSMFANHALIDEFLSVSRQIAESSAEGTFKMDENLKVYFQYNSNGHIVGITKAAEPLMNFLERTSNVQCDEIATFLYMNEDKISQLFGNDLSISLRDSLTSGNEIIVKEKLVENAGKDLTELLKNIVLYADYYDFDKCCIVLINLYDEYEEYNNDQLVNLIGKRIIALQQNERALNSKKINFANLVKVYIKTENKGGIENEILACLDLQEDYANKLEAFFANETSFNDEACIKVQNYIENIAGKNDALDFDDILEINTIKLGIHYKKYFSSVTLFEKLAEITIENNCSLDKKSTHVLKQLFDEHIKDNSINEVLLKCANLFNNRDFYELFSGQIENNTNSINIESANALVAAVITIENKETRSKINRLLAKINWNINDDVKDNLDQYLTQNIDNEIDAILKKITSNKEIKLIPKTIEEINNTVITNTVEYDTIEFLQTEYDENQRSTIFANITSKINFAANPNEDTLEIASELLKRFGKYSENNKHIAALVSKIYEDIQSNPTDQRAKNELELLVPLLSVEDNIGFDKFISYANNPANMSASPTMVLRILDILQSKIPDSVFLSLGNSIMKYSNETDLPTSLRLLRIFRVAFVNNTEEITEYKNFLIINLKQVMYRKEIINDISKHFEQIGNVSEYINEVAKYKDIEEEIESTSIKFLRKLADAKNELKITLEKMLPENSELINKIYLQVLGNDYLPYLEKLCNDANENDDNSYLNNLLNIIVLNTNQINNSVMNLLKIIFTTFDSSEIETVLEAISVCDEVKSRNMRRELGSLLYDLFRQASDNDIKETIYEFVNAFKLSNGFRKDDEKHEREFSSGEKDIINKK